MNLSIKSVLICFLSLALCLGACAESIGIIGGADGPTQIFVTKDSPVEEDGWDEEAEPEGGDREDEAVLGEDDWGEEAESNEDDWGEEAEPDEAEDAEEASQDGWDEDPGTAQISGNRSADEQARIKAEETARVAKLHTAIDNPNLAIEAVLGYGGVITYGRSMPVEVTLKNTGSDLDGSVCLNLYQDYTHYDRVEYPVFLAGGAEKRLVLPVTFAMKQGAYTVEYQVDGQVVAAKNFAPAETVDPMVALVGVLSGDPAAIGYMNLSGKNDPMLRAEYFRTIPLTNANFPDDINRLCAFSLIVVDGVDLRSLDEQQQAALMAWIQGGGTAIVGGGAGAAAGYPFFEGHTGIGAGELIVAGDITPALMAYEGVAEAALGQGVWINAMAGEAGALVESEGHPLIAVSGVGRGLIYTAAFELGAKPLTVWPGMAALWQRVMIKSAPESYQRMFDGHGSWNDDDDYEGMAVVREMPVKNPFSVIPAFILLAGYVLLAGLLSYFLLKRFDKREYLWLTMPLLAVLGALAVWGMGLTAGFNTPVATTYTRVTVDENRSASVATYLGLSTPDSGRVAIFTGTGAVLTPLAQDSDSIYDETLAIRTPSELRNLRVYGEASELWMPAAPAWEARFAKLDAPAPFEGMVDADIWMEEDGLHAQIANNTPYNLENCGVVTSVGYASIPAIAPGEVARTAIVYPSAEEQQAVKDALAADGTRLVQDGRMTTQVLNGNHSDSIYECVEAFVAPKQYDPDPQVRAAARRKRSAPERKEAILIRSMLQNRVYQWTGGEKSLAFHFVAFTQDIPGVILSIGGQTAQRTARRALIDVAMAYDPVSPTGVVFYPRGLLKARPAKLVDGAPVVDDEAGAGGGYYGRGGYFQLSEQPIFMFTLPDGMEVGELDIASSFYDEAPLMRLYNHQAHAFEDQKTAFVTLKGDAASPYIGADGSLFISYAPGGAANAYSSIMAPQITLTGRTRQ